MLEATHMANEEFFSSLISVNVTKFTVFCFILRLTYAAYIDMRHLHHRILQQDMFFFIDFITYILFKMIA